MNLAARKRHYNRCDPSEALDPGDDRYVDLGSVPGRDALFERVGDRIQRSKYPAPHFVSAVPGAGVTTELRRLAERLARTEGPNLQPVWIDAAKTMDLGAPIHWIDIQIEILHAVHAALSGDDTQGAGQGVSTLLQRALSVEINAATFDLLAASPARRRLRDRILDQESAFRSVLRDELIRLRSRAMNAGRGGFVVIIDSLERLQGLSTNADEVRESAERVFQQEAAAFELPVPVVCTLPAMLMAQRLPGGVDVLPMVPATRAGRQALRRLAEARIPAADLRALLGAIRYEQRLERLAEETGGSPRQVVAALQRLLLAGDALPVSEHAFERALREWADEQQRLLSREEWDVLGEVAAHGGRIDLDAPRRATAGGLVARGMLLPYQAESLTFEAHPTFARALRAATA